MDGGACDGRLGKALAKGRDMEFGQWVPGLSPHDTLGQLGARPGYKEGAKNHHILLEGLSLPANATYAGLIPGLGRYPGRGHGNPLQCSCLENPRDGGACWAAVYGVAQSRTRLKRLSSSSCGSLVP